MKFNDNNYVNDYFVYRAVKKKSIQKYRKRIRFGIRKKI